MSKINVGCGNRKIHGFINIDARKEVEPDLVCDATEVSSKFKDVDLIYSCHVIEHFTKCTSSIHSTNTWKEILRDWYKTLKPGGILRLSTPDFEKICEYYVKTKDLKSIMCLLYGGQKYEFDFHFHTWDFESLKSDLEEIGFKDVKKYDWRSVEHFYVDDYSQSYLPHMDKTNGLMMSLNVEAKK